MIDIDTAAIRRMRDYFLDMENAVQHEAEALSESAAEAVLRRAEPFAETMYLVMMADGSSGQEERLALAGARRVLTQGAASDGVIEELLSGFAANLEEFGAEHRLRQLGAHLSANAEDRETAFSLGAVVALADRSVDVRESEFIQIIAEYYGISGKRVDALLNALS